MSNFWTGVSDEKLQEAEDKLVEVSGLKTHEFHSYPVNFTFSEKDWKKKQEDEKEEIPRISGWTWTGSAHAEEIENNEYIWTYEFGDDSKPHLVIIHGYGGSGMVFYRMFKYLQDHFNVFLIDLLGMGRSSRNDFSCKTYDEWERFFVNSIEKWRKAKNFEKLNLLGHSFGGFIASKYALHFPERINKLICFSPWASESSNEDHKEEFDQKIDDLPFFTRIMFKSIKKVYSSGSSPFGWARVAGRWLGGYFIKKAIQKRVPDMGDEEAEVFTEYMHQIIMGRGSSEYGFGVMFPDFNFSDKAISNFLEEYKEHGIEISFYYGSYDWMDTSFNGSHVSEQLRDAGERVYIVDDAGHHLYFGNPEQSSQLIIEDFETSQKI